MCGIAGCVGPSATKELGQDMVARLSHRGPDGSGVFHQPGVVLAHSRLEIEGTQIQPVEFPQGALVYNGEVYEQGDSQAVLTAHLRGHMDRLNGMCAVAVWDGELHLYRDRFGIKPLYWTRIGKDFLFASEVKAFFAHPDFKVEIDREALEEYWTFQNYLEPETTLFKGVYMVSPINGVNTGRVDLEDAILNQIPPRDYGCYLSGGLDSGTIASVLKCRTYTVGFEGGDERGDAETLVQSLGLENYQAFVTKDQAVKSLKEIVWHLEEPRVGNCWPNWFAAKLASKFGRVVFSGTGADELYGGYVWRYGKPREEVWTRLPKVTSRKRALEKLHDLYDGVDDGEFERKTFLHGLLVVEDKLSMAHGLETRVPFLDNRLWPDRDIGKTKLRERMQKICPELVNKPKQGFSANDGDWFQQISPKVYEYISPVESDSRLYRWSLAYFSEFCDTWLP